MHIRAQAFLQPEQLDAADSWYCGRCKEHVRAEKKLDLWSLPELLVVHLKRFSYSRHSRDKLDAPVHFPLSALDLSSFLLREQVPLLMALQAFSSCPAQPCRYHHIPLPWPVLPGEDHSFTARSW